MPSLRGVWFRNGFGRGGQAETLEEWYDPARLQDNYVAKGFHLGPGPIEGHDKGLDLSPEDRQALIAFLEDALMIADLCIRNRKALTKYSIGDRPMHSLTRPRAAMTRKRD